VHAAAWYARCEPRPADIAVGIPTFNRPADCVNALKALTSTRWSTRSSTR
jgi:galactofuranosylgalactofuranosylrhamnosyl-N-acetylglucosaminyl-diphospho-decaprenol beta-1,5/1,6-galactofuranosyltransferase